MAISHRLPSSSAVVLVVHHRHPSVCQNAHPHFTDYICRFPPQDLSAICPLQHLHICTSTFYHWPLKRRHPMHWLTCPVILWSITMRRWYFPSAHGIVYPTELSQLTRLTHLEKEKMGWINFVRIRKLFNEFRAQMEGTGSCSEVSPKRILLIC